MHEKATAGDAEAKFELSLAYYDGDGVEKDEEKALTLLTEAARTEYLPAMRSYANRLLDGVGAPQDKQAGMAMLMKAAEAGHAGAQGDLGLCYLNGDDGVEFDYEKALFWLERSAKTGGCGIPRPARRGLL